MEKQDLRQLLELSITSGRQGAKAAEVSLIRSVVSALVDALPTTVEPTQTVPTTDNPSDVEEHMFQPTRAYSQWDPVDTKNGPVEHNSECAHKWKTSTKGMYHWWTEPLDGTYRYIEICLDCRALMWSDKTVAQDVDPTSSTSVKQDLKKSVVNSVEVSVESPSNELNKGWWTNGYEMIYGEGMNDGQYHWHSSHRHPDGDRWHIHEE